MKQFNNKILIIILLVLTGMFVVSKLIRSPRRESNLSDALTSVDTAKVSEVRIQRAASANGKAIKLVRSGNNWTVQSENKTANADAATVKNLLEAVRNVKAERLMTKETEKWSNYEVTDSAGTHLVVTAGEPLADWWIGKRSGGFTYVREDEEDEVYAVNESLLSSVDRDFNEWRDKSFLSLLIDNVTDITFTYPADSGFVLTKKDNAWMLGNEKADSASVQSYLNKFSRKKLTSFADDVDLSGKASDIIISFKNGNVTLSTVQAWKREDDWVLTSSQYEGVFFSSKGSSIEEELFVGRNDFNK